MSQRDLRRTDSVFRRTRFGCLLLLFFMLVPLPVVAQGPQPVGLQHLPPAGSASPLHDSGPIVRDEESRAARGAAIGFTVAVAIVLLSANSPGNNDRSGAKIYIVPAGLIGGYIGYLVGRRY
jgi:hypothetical protein